MLSITYIRKPLIHSSYGETGELHYTKVALKHNSLVIDGLYQGMYDVIGDKMGGDSVVYFTDPTEFEYHLTSCIVSLTFPSNCFMQFEIILLL